MKIERRPHTDLDRPERVAVRGGEVVLLRAAQPKEDDPRPAAVDPLDHRPVFFGRERAEGRGLGPRDRAGPGNRRQRFSRRASTTGGVLP